MNREIKFRAWDKKDNKMLYGIEDEDHGAGVVDIEGCEIASYEKCFGDYLHNNRYEVMQFSGFHDKNGKEIFENDIIKIDDPEEDSTGFVLFDKGTWYLQWLYRDEDEPQIPVLSNLYEFHLDILDIPLLIVGNIYENPELLK